MNTVQQTTPKPATRMDAALTLEIEALIADRGLTQREAAVKCGMSEVTLVHRLRGHSSWTVRDIEGIAYGLAVDGQEGDEMVLRLARVAFGAK